MEEFKQTVGVLAGIASVFGLWKLLLEINVFQANRVRSQYDLAMALAQRSSDAAMESYALELGYKILIGDNNISMAQRRALLTLPNRTLSISRYMKARSLLSVRVHGPVLRWKLPRHAKKWYRKLLTILAWQVYVAFASCGFMALFVSETETGYRLLDEIVSLPPHLSLSMVFLGATALYFSTKLSVAEDLVLLAEAVGPFPE